MAQLKIEVNVLGVIPQYEKEESGQKNNDGSIRMKNTTLIKGYHVFYATPVKKWVNDSQHQTIALKDFNEMKYHWLKDLKYLDVMSIVVEIEDIGTKPTFLRFEEIKK